MYGLTVSRAKWSHLAVEHWVKQPELFLVISIELEVVDLVIGPSTLEGHVVDDKD